MSSDWAIDHDQMLIRAIAAKESDYDAQVGMLRRPFHSPGYHTSLTAERYPFIHPTYPSLLYAVGLLHTNLAGYEQRACDIIGSVLALQDRVPESSTYGIWPWFYEEPLEQMAPPDWNWADFCGKELVLAVLRHGHKLPEGLKLQVKEAVSCACDAIIRRNVGPNYTNIAIMGAFVTLIAGELYGRKDYAEYGLERLEKLQRYTAGLGSFQEFNSPAYTVIAIVELSKIRQYSRNPRAKEIAEELLELAWRMVAEHYHPRSGQWAGPHSRSYSTLLTGKAKSFLQLATGNKLAFFAPDELEYDSEWYGSGIYCPDAFVEMFLREEERTLRQPYYRNEETGFEKWAETYMTPQYSLGYFGHEIMWNQTRGMVAYFDNNGQSTYWQMRCLHDGYDYCSAVLTVSRNGGHLLLGVSFLVNGGDTHPTLDRIQGSIEASDFRIRMEFGGCLEQVGIQREGTVAQVNVGGLPLRFESLYAAFEGAGVTSSSDIGGEAEYREAAGWEWEVNRLSDVYGLDLVIYSGERRRIDFDDSKKAGFLFAVAVGDAAGRLPLLEVKEESGLATVMEAERAPDGHAQHQVSIGLKPGDKHPNE